MLRLLAVHAHPDDESSKGAATYAYYRSRGARVMVVSCTGGDSGSILNDALESRAHARRDMTGFRYLEMERARDVMGIEHRWLGFTDSGLPEGDETIRADSFAALPLEFSGPPLAKLMREFKPQVLVTYDENGGYPHPDHIRAHEVAIWAKDVAADAAQYPELGAPWAISKLYYDRIFSPERFGAVYDLLVERDPESPLVARLTEMREWMGRERGPKPTTFVPAGDFFDVRDEALRQHASQVAPDSDFFFWPNDIQRDAWPTEDFQLVSTTVETTLPESDLFAGVVDNQEDEPE